jgi:hypothetical protein
VHFRALGARLGAEHVEAAAALREREQAISALLAPVRESLVRVGTKLEELERDRREAQGRLGETLRARCLRAIWLSATRQHAW